MECDCTRSIESHVFDYTDPRLDVPFGDEESADTLRKRVEEYVARKYICMDGCYDRSMCVDVECRRAHFGDAPLRDEGTVRAFRRVYLEKEGARMQQCLSTSCYNGLLCPFLHYRDEPMEIQVLEKRLKEEYEATVVPLHTSVEPLDMRPFGLDVFYVPGIANPLIPYIRKGHSATTLSKEDKKAILESGDLESLKQNLEHFIGPSAEHIDDGEEDQLTALSFASNRGNLMVVKLLIHCGCDINSTNILRWIDDRSDLQKLYAWSAQENLYV
jgi:hypothetical protein